MAFCMAFCMVKDKVYGFLYGLLSADTATIPGASNVAIWKDAEFTDLVKKAQKTFDFQRGRNDLPCHQGLTIVF